MEPAYKRRRLASDHGLGAELQERRARNDLRLKSAFESIFDKYGKDFTGIGDEIDLETGEIIVDHGHLSAMKSENDPGRKEDLYDELNIDYWSSDEKLSRSSVAKKTHKKKIKTSVNHSKIRSDISPQFTYDSFNLLDDIDILGDMDITTSPGTMNKGDAEIFHADDGYESGEPDIIVKAKGAQFAKPSSQMPVRPSILTHLREQKSNHTPQDECAVELAWQVPLLPNRSIPHQEDSPLEALNVPETDRERSISPPGPSLWASTSSNHSRNTSTSRKKNRLFHQRKSSSNAQSSKMKHKHDENNFVCLSYVQSRTSIHESSEQRPFIPQISQPLTPSGAFTLTPTANFPWTDSEDQLLHYLKCDLKLPYSQIVKRYLNRSEAEIEDHWFNLRLAKSTTLYTGWDRKSLHSNLNSATVHKTAGTGKSSNLLNPQKFVTAKTKKRNADTAIICDILSAKGTQGGEISQPNKLRKRRQSDAKGTPDIIDDSPNAASNKYASTTIIANRVKGHHVCPEESHPSIETQRASTNRAKKTIKSSKRLDKLNDRGILNKSISVENDHSLVISSISMTQEQDPILKSTVKIASSLTKHQSPKMHASAGDSVTRKMNPPSQKKKLSNQSTLPKPIHDTTQNQLTEPLPGSSKSHPLRIPSTASPEPPPEIPTDIRFTPIPLHPKTDSPIQSCDNCSTRTTPRWHGKSKGHRLCNACDAYHRRYRLDRPSSKRAKTPSTEPDPPPAKPAKSQSPPQTKPKPTKPKPTLESQMHPPLGSASHPTQRKPPTRSPSTRPTRSSSTRPTRSLPATRPTRSPPNPQPQNRPPTNKDTNLSDDELSLPVRPSFKAKSMLPVVVVLHPVADDEVADELG